MMIDLELSDKPEVHQISALLQLEPDAVVGKLIRVWSWFDKQTVDGHAPSVTHSVVDRVAQRDGFAEAMSTAYWLEQSKDGLRMPKFDTWNGQSAKKRALANRRQSKKRNANVTQESRTERDKNVTREEKRRVTPIVPETFLQFWTAYPRKEAKAKALEAFKKIVFINGDFEKLLAALEAAKGSDQWRRDAGKFIPHAATWLNGRRFEDEVTQPVKAAWTP